MLLYFVYETYLRRCIWVARPKYAQGLPHNGYQMTLDLKKKLFWWKHSMFFILRKIDGVFKGISRNLPEFYEILRDCQACSPESVAGKVSRNIHLR